MWLQSELDTMLNNQKNLFILSGPSGCGKNTVFDELKKRVPIIQRAITVTTRELREHEVHGRDYYFVSELEFSRWKETGLFVESSFYDNAYYATPVSELERYSSDTPVFLIIDTLGKESVLRRYPKSSSIFLMPPSLDEVLHRIKERGANNEEQIERRMQRAKSEVAAASSYDYILINHNLDDCVAQLEEIVSQKLSSLIS